MSEKVEKIKGDIKKIEASIKVYSKKNDATSKKIIQSFKSKLDVFEKELQKAEKEEQSALKKIKIRATSKKVADLKKLISSKKYAIYKNSDVDLEKDAARPALPIGKRKSKITGNTYYEYRANRIDVKQPAKRYPKLEHGGELETMSEKEFLQKYWGANVFTEDVSKHFDIKKMSSSNDAKIEKFLEELKKDGYSIKKKSYSDFTSVMGVKKMNKLEHGGYMADGGEVDNYVEVNGTFYKKGTPQGVINALENARNNRTRVKIFYGDPETGRDWHEELDTTGTIGRSTGSIKIPLLIPTSRSIGGGSILTKNIVKIRDTQNGRVLYQNENYKQPNIEIVESTTDGYTHELIIDGELYSRHKSKRSAEMLKSKMMADGGMMAKGGYMAKGGGIDGQKIAKPSGWRWKNSAVTDGIISESSLYKTPSERMRKMYPDYVDFENRPTKSDKNPSKKFISLETGGKIKGYNLEIELFFKGLSGNNRKIGKYVVTEKTLDNLEEEWSHVLTIDVIDETNDNTISYYDLKKEIFSKGREAGFFETGGQMANGSEIPKEKSMLNFILYEASSGMIANKTNYDKYKDIDGIRSSAISILMRDGDRIYSISNFNDLIQEAVLEYEENKFGYADGGYMANGGEVLSSFSIDEMKKYLDEKFEYSFGFKVYPIKKGTIFTPDYDSEIIKGRMLKGLSDFDLKGQKLSFPNYKRNHQINFKVSQGEENTYFEFLLMDDTDYYSGTFGFKDNGDVSSDYITRFIAFLMQQYGLPFQIEHNVFEHGGYMAHGGEMEDDFMIWDENGKKYELFKKEGDIYYFDSYGTNFGSALTISEEDLKNKIRQGKYNFSKSYMAYGGMLNHGFNVGDKILDIYKGQGIVENNNNGVIEVINPSKGTRFIIGLDDSKRSGRRESVEMTIDEAIKQAKKYIDYTSEGDKEVLDNFVDIIKKYGQTYAKGGGIEDIDMNEVESSAIFYTDESKWTSKPTIKKFADEIAEKEKLKKMLDNKEITPSKIIGTGYKSQYARPLAYRWLNERILIAKRAIEILQERGQTYAHGGELHRLQQ